MTVKESSAVVEPGSSAPAEVEYRAGLDDFFSRSPGSFVDRLKDFPKYAPRQTLATFLAKYKIFKRVLSTHGSVMECGVYNGGVFLTFAQLSAILEPYNHQRKIIGFDTFAGFPELSAGDKRGTSVHSRKGGMKADSFDNLSRAIALFDKNRPLGHVPKVSLVRGDVGKTMPRYFAQNPHTIVSLLYLDLDIFEPTRAALRCCLPRMPRGAVIAFDELNRQTWPGETLALAKTVGISNLKLERFPFEPNISFAVLDGR